jgi:hypothetical protein
MGDADEGLDLWTTNLNLNFHYAMLTEEIALRKGKKYGIAHHQHH